MYEKKNTSGMRLTFSYSFLNLEYNKLALQFFIETKKLAANKSSFFFLDKLWREVPKRS